METFEKRASTLRHKSHYEAVSPGYVTIFAVYQEADEEARVLSLATTYGLTHDSWSLGLYKEALFTSGREGQQKALLSTPVTITVGYAASPKGKV